MKSLKLFKALSDATRLRLLNLFMHHELNVNELVAVLRMGQSRISRHLKILSESGLVTSRRDGLWIFYKATDNENDTKFLGFVQHLMDDDPVFRADLDQAEGIIRERTSESTKFFDNIAEDWLRLKHEIFADFDMAGLIKKYIPRVHTLVDLGCGTGDLLPEFDSLADLIIGVDNSAKMLESAYRRFLPKKAKIDLRIGDLRHLPLRDGEADLCVINMVLHHLQTPPEVFAEVFRVLKPGSIFVLADFLSHTKEEMRRDYGDRWLGFDTDTVESWFAKYGFTPKARETYKLNKGLEGFIYQVIK